MAENKNKPCFGIKRGLIIKKHWLDKILSGEKIWELRSRPTRITGRIALIESGSGMIMGETYLLGCEDMSKMKLVPGDYFFHHRVRKEEMLEKYKFAWKLRRKCTVRYSKPISYDHPQGAVVWVKLGGDR